MVRNWSQPAKQGELNMASSKGSQKTPLRLVRASVDFGAGFRVAEESPAGLRCAKLIIQLSACTTRYREASKWLLNRLLDQGQLLPGPSPTSTGKYFPS